MISTSQLAYDSTTNVFTADMAELSHRGFAWEQAYPDACDLGVTVVSQRTGRSIMFVVNNEEWVGDDLVAWHLTPAKASRDVRVNSMRLTIFND